LTVVAEFRTDKSRGYRQAARQMRLLPTDRYRTLLDIILLWINGLCSAVA
jgi:hypothetical protein